MEDKKKKIKLEDARKRELKEYMQEFVNDSELPTKAAEWFYERIDYYNWNFKSIDTDGKEYLSNLVDRYIGGFYEEFTKKYREEYKQNFFEIFKEKTKEILINDVKVALTTINTVLFEDMKRMMISEINFQIAVADYITEDHLREIILNKIYDRYKDRMELVNSKSEYNLWFTDVLRVYFKAYLFNNYLFISRYDRPKDHCWYKEGWGLMTWIYKLNGGTRCFQTSHYTYNKLYESFMTCKNKNEFFAFLRKEKDYTRSNLDRYEAIEKARDRWLKDM